MRWRKLKVYLKEYPYLLDDHFQMSMAQARKLQEEDGYMSFEDMVCCAKRKSNLPAKAWIEVDTAIAKYYKHRFIGFPHFYTPIFKRAVLTAVCILIIVGYFTLVPSGRAFASTITEAIVEFFDNSFRFTSTNADLLPEKTGTFDETITEFSSFEAIEKSTGKQFLQIRGDKYALESLQLYNSNLAGNSVYAFYKTRDGHSVSLYHNWGITTDYWGQISQDDSIWEEQLSDGTVVYCSTNAIDHTFTAYAIQRDMFITIYADEGVQYEDVLAAIY